MMDDIAGTEYVAGLDIEVEVDADTPDEAIRRGPYLVIFLSSFLSLLSNIGLPEPKLESIVPHPRQKEDYELLKYFDLQIDRPSLRGVEVEDVGALYRQSRLIDANFRDRILRAVRWYSHALQESDLIDQFLGFWFSLESLDIVARKELNCKGGKYSTQAIENLFAAEAPEDANAIGDARKLRSMIVHGLRPLGEEVRLAVERLIPVLQRSIVRVLNRILHTDQLIQPASEQVRVWRSPRAYVKLLVRSDSPSVGLLKDFVSRVEIELRPTNSIVPVTGELSVEYDVRISVPEFDGVEVIERKFNLFSKGVRSGKVGKTVVRVTFQ